MSSLTSTGAVIAVTAEIAGEVSEFVFVDDEHVDVFEQGVHRVGNGSRVEDDDTAGVRGRLRAACRTRRPGVSS